MAYLNCIGLFKKMSDSEPDVISGLRMENLELKNRVVELSRQHPELVESVLSLKTGVLNKGECYASSSQQNGSATTLSTLPAAAREIEEIKNKLVRISTRCQSMENKVTRKKDSTLDGQASAPPIELQPCLSDALEKNKQWEEYHQQREAYVRAITSRMLWLEKQLNEANQALSKQHNKEHSDDNMQVHQMAEHYERLLQKAKDELFMFREKLDGTCQKLLRTERQYKKREMEVEELKQQLNSAKMCEENAQGGHHWFKEEERHLRDECEFLKQSLDMERRRSANFELQTSFFQKYMLNCHRADQEKIADLERQVNISSKDLDDEKQDCSYLKKQMTKVLRMLRKTEDRVAKQFKGDEQDYHSCEVSAAPSQSSSHNVTSSAHNSSLLNESCLECPGCHTEYPAINYRELMNHLEMCLE